VSEKLEEISQKFLQDTNVLPKLVSFDEHCSPDILTGGNPIAVLMQIISDVSAINPLVAFSTSMEERER
jgi:hypothetical protein